MNRRVAVIAAAAVLAAPALARAPDAPKPAATPAQPTATDFDAPPDPGLVYRPAHMAKAKVGPTLPVGKCINISNTLEAPAEGKWGTKVAEDDLQIIKSAGFTTVRIPVAWSAHADASAPYTIDPAFIARIRHVVGLATAAGLNVVLNVHNYNELHAQPVANRDRFAALWRQIGAAFADEPASVWFELDNEPNDRLSNANLLGVMVPALKAVRETNPTRPVIIGGDFWSNVESLPTLELPDDPYVVPTFHYYQPFAFTHQGETWLAHPPKFGRGYGSAADKAMLDRDLKAVKAYMDRTGRTPVLGEFGATNDPRVPLEVRIRYYHTISSAFASIGVPSCAWGYRRGFALRDGDHWVPGLVEAIAAPTK
jgi:endoglucanase